MSSTIDSLTSRRWVSALVGLPGILLSVAVIAFAIDGYLPKRLFTNLVLGLALVSYFLSQIRSDRFSTPYDWRDGAFVVSFLLFVLATILSVAYVHVAFQRWLDTGSLMIYTNVDLVVGALLIVLVTAVTADQFGRVLGGLVVLTALYGIFGPYLPGILSHSGLTIETIIFKNTIALSGVYGFLTQIAATWVAIFVIFASLVRAFGGFDLIRDLTRTLDNSFRSAVPQTAVVSSMFMGTMMGGSGVNVAATGSFTIPLMEDRGIDGKHAGAIESVASTAGQVLPPVMGSAAFIMSDILGVPFADVAIAAAIPAFLYYFVTSYGVYQWSLWHGWDEGPGGEDETAPEPETEQSDGSRIGFYLRSLQFIVPLVVLVYYLIVQRYGPLYSGLYTVLSLFAMRLLYLGLYEERGLHAATRFVRELVTGLRDGGEAAGPFVALLAALSVVITILSSTGLTNRITFALTGLTGASFIGILVISMLLALLFGLGIPTPAAYLLVATLIAPVVVQMGAANGFEVQPITAHMFVFYFALLSALTPPVALSVAMAVNITGSDFLETVWESLRLGGATFLIPFVFVYHPELLFWSFPVTLITLVMQFIGIVAAASALLGVEFGERIPRYERVVRAGLFFAIAFGPSLSISVGSAIVFAVLVFRRTMYASSVIRGFRSVVR